MTGVIADIPNPINVVTNALSGVTGWAFDKVAQGIASWVLGAVEFFVNGAIDFLRSSVRPDVEGAWFSGAGSPYAQVRNMAGFLLVGFVFLGLIQGLLAGDPAGMVRRMAGNLPAAIAGMIVTTIVVGRLLDLTDAMSNAVLANTDDHALHFLAGFGATVTSSTQGFAAVLLGLVAVIAGLLLWVELIVRASLIYVLVAVSPLGFAATLWPAAKGALRKIVELLMAVVLSKLVICITLAIGVAALSGAGTAGQGAGLASRAGASLGALLVGAVLLALASFSPFIILKLVPIAEAALVAQGVSRSPLRATQTGMSTAYSASMLTRLAGKGGGLPGTSGSAGATGAFGPAAGASAIGPSAAGGGAAAGAAGAAAGPAGVAVAAGSAVLGAAAKAGRATAQGASAAADSARGSPADAPGATGGKK